MRMRSSTVFVALILGSIAVATPGCEHACGESAPFESGDYLIVEPGDRPLVHWALGGQLHVDREQQIATIRYTRDGTTYEVHYTLEY